MNLKNGPNLVFNEQGIVLNENIFKTDKLDSNITNMLFIDVSTFEM